MNEDERAEKAVERNIARAKERLKAKKARKDFKTFAPAVLRDEKTGKPITLAAIHELAIDFVLASFSAGKFPAIQLPVEHGKSSIFAVAWPLWCWTNDRNEAIKLVSSSQDIVKTRIRQIQSYVTGKHDGSLNRISPNLQPDKKEGWAKDQIHLQREVTAFPSLWAHPVLGTAEGGRCGGLILDDAVSRANSIQKDLCQDVIDAIEDSWLKRLHAGGWAMALNTPWTTKDYMAHLRKSRLGQWAILRVPVNKTLDGYDVEVAGLPGFNAPTSLPLWNRFSRAYFQMKIEGEGIRAFRRNFQLDPYSEDERKLPHFEQSCKAGAGQKVEDILRAHGKGLRFMGVDPGGEGRPGTAIFVLQVAPNSGKRMPLSIRYGQWGPREVAEQVIADYLKWEPAVAYVENNALQAAFVDLIRLIPDAPVIPIRGFTTGRQKADPSIGIEGIDIELANGDWIIPAGEFDSHEVGCRCDWCRWKDEVGTYPNCETSDGLMATWFAWSAARMGGGKSVPAASYGDSEFADDFEE